MSAAQRWLIAAACAVGAWAALHAIEVAGAEFGFGGPWTVRSSLLPAYARPLAIWACAGTVAAAFAAGALWSVSDAPFVRRAVDRLTSVPHRAWILSLSATGVALALAIRWWVSTQQAWGLALMGDSLWGYGFTPPLPTSVAAIAWVPPLLVGGTTPAVYLVTRRWLGSGWAVVAAALFATSPMVVLGGGTLFPGTGLAFVAAWGLYVVDRARDRGDPRREAYLLAALVLFGVTLESSTGLGLGVALCAAWAWDNRGAPGEAFRNALLIPLVIGVVAVLLWRGFTSNFGVEPATVLAVPGAAAVRVSLESLGWPIGVVPALFAAPSRGRRLALLLIAGLLLPNLFVGDLGPGLYGPERLHAMVVPVVLLVVLGLANVRVWNPSEAWGRALAAGTVAIVLVTAVGYTPQRIATLVAVAAESRPVEPEAPLRRKVGRSLLPTLPSGDEAGPP